MTIEHLALWTKDLENMKNFYTTYFGGQANNIYENTIKQFQSYFITFESGSRIELMTKPNLTDQTPNGIGYAHFAFSLGSPSEVDALTERLKNDGYQTTPPRTTGDGYYESNIIDPDGNMIEITV